MSACEAPPCSASCAPQFRLICVTAAHSIWMAAWTSADLRDLFSHSDCMMGVKDSRSDNVMQYASILSDRFSHCCYVERELTLFRPCVCSGFPLLRPGRAIFVVATGLGESQLKRSTDPLVPPRGPNCSMDAKGLGRDTTFASREFFLFEVISVSP